jgi:hypothetical protein
VDGTLLLVVVAAPPEHPPPRSLDDRRLASALLGGALVLDVPRQPAFLLALPVGKLVGEEAGAGEEAVGSNIVRRNPVVWN